MEMEIWRDIDGYEGIYQVSNLGNVKSLERKVSSGYSPYKIPERILKPISVGNYFGVQLSVKGKSKKFYIHRLVAKAFIANEEEKSTVNHKDGNRFNNKVDNLEWMTQKENNEHATENGWIKRYGEDNPVAKYSNEVVIKMRTDYETGLYTQKELAEKYGMSKMNAHNILTYKLRKDVI